MKNKGPKGDVWVMLVINQPLPNFVNDVVCRLKQEDGSKVDEKYLAWLEMNNQKSMLQM